MATLNTKESAPLLSPARINDRMAMQDHAETTPRIQFTIARCSLGQVLIATTEHGLCAILFGDCGKALEDDLKTRFPNATFLADGKKVAALRTVVLEFIENPSRDAKIVLDPVGTEFQKRVWHALRQIEPGSTASYKDIAQEIGSPKAMRAVARACAANPIAVAIPCHRVVRSDGSLSGYRWGVERKRALLEREGQS